MKVMIDRSAGSIALMKIFGYRDREIRKLYLDGNFLLIAAGALLLIPLAKVLMDALYPSFVANIACGVDLSWPLSLYLLVYAGILICYLLIRSLLMRRLKQTTPAEVLKDRE
jgi:putative ABC transport system permease protein